MGSHNTDFLLSSSRFPVLRMNSSLLLALTLLLSGCLASPSPKERLKVKYKIRTGSHGVEKQKINEEILRSEETEESLNNLVQIEREQADVVNNYRSVVTGV